MRGEQVYKLSFIGEGLGSPPLARGTALGFIHYRLNLGITPACAGNSPFAIRLSALLRDHPRLRGEQIYFPRLAGRLLGSPPLARGTASRRSTVCNNSGITPACAGNSGCSAGVTPSRWDHPRLRGEQQASGKRSSISEGSPPLARGTATADADGSPRTGITPACAGNSSSAPIFQGRRGDHPRLRGEQRPLQSKAYSGVGSPPLARGTEMEMTGEYAAFGITPACAGNRPLRPFSALLSRDHPRLRGEQKAPIRGHIL